MRIALLSAVKRTPTGELRADLRLAGRSVLAWQAETMLALGCERILCLCDASSETIVAVQRLIEAAGAEFHAIRGVTQIAALVRPQDEIIMLRDGLLVETDVLARGDPSGYGSIITIPTAHRLVETHPEDFERIDRDRHWAGFAAMSANRISELADYPTDSEAMSLLLRLGLQAQTPCEELAEDALRSRQWLLASDGDALEEFEASLVANALPNRSWLGPSAMLARTGVKAAAPVGLEIGHSVSAVAGMVLGLAGIALVALDLPVTGLAISALGAFLAEVSGTVSSLRGALFKRGNASVIGRALSPAMAAFSAIAVFLAVTLSGGELVLLAIPVLSLGLAFHLSEDSSAPVQAFFGDRALHLMVFAIAAAFGLLVQSVAVLGLLALAQLMLQARRQ